MNTATCPALLALDSPLYLKRLARECNALPDGFYSGAARFTSARVRGDALQGRMLGRTTFVRASWVTLEPADLRDAYGRTVCATRAPKHA